MAVSTEMSFTLLPFTTIFLFVTSSPFLLFTPSSPPRPSHLQRWQGYQSMSSCFLPDPFVSTLRRINSPVTHRAQPINFLANALVVFEGGESQLDSLSPQSCASTPPSSSPPLHLPISGKHIFILAWSFDYSNNCVWLHLKCCLARLWKSCQLVLERWVTWGCCVCMCVCERERDREKDC